MSQISPITGSIAQKAFIKGGEQYYTDELGNFFCNALDQSGMIGGISVISEEDRNDESANTTRLQRIKDITGKLKPIVLDFGCGNGKLVSFATKNGIDTKGYDKFVNSTHSNLSQKYDCILLIEVVEHLSEPFDELKMVHQTLNFGGKVMIETSFSNWLKPDDSYIDPVKGHCTIFSHAGLDHLMQLFGFKVSEHINNNVRIYGL